VVAHDWVAQERTLDDALHFPGLSASERIHLVDAHARLVRMKCWVALSEGMAEAGPVGNLSESLPGPVRRWAQDLNSVEDLVADFGRPWTKEPDVAALGRKLTIVEEYTGDSALTKRLQVELANKAASEGYPDAAGKLRDLKIEPRPGVAPLPEEGPPPPIPLLIPEATPGARPPLVESPRAGLPSLEVKQVAQQMRSHLQAEVSRQLEFGSNMTSSHLYLARFLSQKLGRSADSDEDRRKEEERRGAIAAVPRSLGRPLTPAERILASHMHGRGQQPAAIAKVLQQLSKSTPQGK
jgi:hypothetical protein